MTLKKAFALLCALALLFMSVVVAAQIIKTLIIPTTGIVAEGVLSISPSSIDWGNVTPTMSTAKNVTLKNTGTGPVYNLNMTIQKVVALTNYTVTWNLEGQTILATENATATFTLTVYNYTTTNFGFDIVITYAAT